MLLKPGTHAKMSKNFEQYVEEGLLKLPFTPVWSHSGFQLTEAVMPVTTGYRLTHGDVLHRTQTGSVAGKRDQVLFCMQRRL